MKDTTLGLKKFKKLATRTINHLGRIELTKTDSTKYFYDLDFAHMVTGIVSELSDEFMGALEKGDKINAGEELGDAEWFCCNLATFLGIHLLDSYAEFAPQEDHLTNILRLPAQLVDHSKGQLAYGKPMPSISVLKRKIELILASIEYVAKRNEIDMPTMRLRVIAKLYKRYPEGFSNDKALIRNLDVERIALEGK